MILYPTETLYALGVHALDQEALAMLYTLKERDASKAASWLVRDMDDVHRYADVPSVAAEIAKQFLPGPLTLVLKAKISISDACVARDRTIGFRISNDPHAQQVIAEHFQKHDAPLTCTSANVSGCPTLPTPEEILQQFGSRASAVTRIVNDGPRKNLASTIVRVVGNDVTVLREGQITQEQIEKCIASWGAAQPEHAT